MCVNQPRRRDTQSHASWKCADIHRPQPVGRSTFKRLRRWKGGPTRQGFLAGVDWQYNCPDAHIPHNQCAHVTRTPLRLNRPRNTHTSETGNYSADNRHAMVKLSYGSDNFWCILPDLFSYCLVHIGQAILGVQRPVICVAVRRQRAPSLRCAPCPEC